MNYTKNYQLPQWVESDRVLMDDFNDANAKVDRALAENKEFCTNFVKLRETVSSGSRSVLSVTVSDLNLEEYCVLLIDIQLKGCDGSTVRFDQNISCTGHIIASTVAFSGLGATDEDGNCTVVLFCGKSGDRMPFGIYQNQDGLGVGGYYSGITFSSAKDLTIVANSSTSIASGSRVTIWGLR